MTIPRFFYFCFFSQKNSQVIPPPQKKKKSGKLRAEKGKIWEFLEKKWAGKEKNLGNSGKK